MLNGKLSLHDIQDVEAFAARILSRHQPELSHHDREDLHAWLIACVWELSLRYRPGGVTFSSWAGHKLGLRIIDWRRSRDGRTRWQFAHGTYERPRPQLVSLDAGGLEPPFSHIENAGVGDLVRALRAGDGEAARRFHANGARADDRAA